MIYTVEIDPTIFSEYLAEIVSNLSTPVDKELLKEIIYRVLVEEDFGG